ncbi:scavenger receptor class F member 1-like [Littorina saxatilis]|uniref:scavenger receptor class F member 1-like n=1 Tax=Littorina saxatilis TaxID=31220 RepID=UPI0038B61FDD
MQRRMSGIHVEVDSQTCYAFPLLDDNETALLALPEKIDVTCTPPLTGRVVRLQKRLQPWNYQYGAHIINICEVQVWGCRDGLYGADCGEQCGQCAGSDTCSAVSGHCPNRCQPGWKGDNCKRVCHNGGFGDNCSEPCGYCSGGDQCDPFTGTCALCQPQFQPPLCEVCTGKMYGARCDLNCSTKCGGDGSCEQDTGRCVEGCVAGYRPGEKGFCNDGKSLVPPGE